MKKIKQTLKTLCAIFGLLLINQKASAVSIADGGTAYLCYGTVTEIDVTGIPSGYVIGASASNWTFTGINHTVTSYIVNGCNLSITANSSGSLTARVLVSGSSPYYINLTFYVVNTYISGSTSEACYGSTPYFTAHCTSPNVTSWSWSLPSFMTISSGSGTSSINANDNHHGSGYVSCTVTTSEGCSVGNLGLTGDWKFTSDSGVAGAPMGSLQWTQAGVSCLYNANVGTIAKSYEWAFNSSFSPLLETTTSPSTGGAEFDYSTTYTVYVRVYNACNTTYGQSHTFIQTTPGKRPGCAEAPIRPPSQTAVNGFKVYPNPLSNELTIEYPLSSVNSSETVCTIYDMLGEKISSWQLPPSDGIATENVSGLSVGMYIYTVTSGSDIVLRGKLLIQR